MKNSPASLGSKKEGGLPGIKTKDYMRNGLPPSRGWTTVHGGGGREIPIYIEEERRAQTRTNSNRGKLPPR